MKFKLIIAVASLALLNSCTAIDPAVRLTYAISGLSQDDDETGTGELSGTWNGNWTSNSTNKEGLINANFSHTESILSGTFSLENSPCMDSGNIYGTVSDNKVNMLIRSGNNTFKIDTFRNPDSSISGIYNITKGECKGSSGKVLLTQTNQTYKVKEHVSKAKERTSSSISSIWDKLKPKFREESPLWYMTLSNEEINSYFKKTCIKSGHSESRASDLNNCIKAARKLSSKNANNRLYQAGQQMQQMDRQRINKHNIAVDKMKQDSQRARTNVYDTNGRLKGYDSYGKWYNKQGQATGEYVKNDKIYDADNKYIGFKRGNQFFNINGEIVARE